MRNAILALTVVLLSACTSTTGSAIMIGQGRPAIDDWESVEIVTAMPDGATQIALVKGSSADGGGQQEKVDFALAELRKQAAKESLSTLSSSCPSEK